MTEAATEERRIEYVPLTDLVFADVNPKEHDTDALRDSVRRFGFTEPGLLDERTGKLAAGHGRAGVLTLMHAAGEAAPPGVQLFPDGSWAIPLTRGWASRDDKEAQAYLIASNRMPEKGGWNETELAGLLAGMEQDLRDAAGWSQDEYNDLLERATVLEGDDRNYGGGPAGPPSEFPEYGPDAATTFQCPSCHYEWNGQPK